MKRKKKKYEWNYGIACQKAGRDLKNEVRLMAHFVFICRLLVSCPASFLFPSFFFPSCSPDKSFTLQARLISLQVD